MSKSKESPEEHGEGKRAARGTSGPFDGGGFSDGEYGRGSTPYMRKHSGKPGGHSLEAHSATSGRGGTGIFGGGDDHKGHNKDYEHPSSHSEFESLGTERE